MNVDLSILVSIDTGKLDPDVRRHAEMETESQGFPISEENTAWMVTEMIASEAGSLYGPGITVEMGF